MEKQELQEKLLQVRFFMQDPDKSSSYLKTADFKPSILLDGETPRLIDEWQMAPVLWDAVRHTVDMRGKTDQFILTSSAVPQDDAVKHTRFTMILRSETMEAYQKRASANI